MFFDQSYSLFLQILGEKNNRNKNDDPGKGKCSKSIMRLWTPGPGCDFGILLLP